MGIINSFIRFLKSLFSASGDVGSKRVVGFVASLTFTAQCIANMVFGTQIQGELILANVSIIAACFGLNALIAIKALSAKSQVASDIVKEDASIGNTAQAAEVLKDEPK